MWSDARTPSKSRSLHFLTSYITMLRNFSRRRVPADGNTAAASIAYELSETTFIYPISPATPMGELMDSWIAQGRKNVWGNKVHLTMMQAENGVAGALHGATTAGTVASSFSASQGLLLMIPDMYKLVHERLPGVIHIASRSIANGGMSIFNDHADVYCARSTGIPMISSSTVQEAYDFGAIAHLITINNSVPFLHFFDGYRTSHEVNTFSDLTSPEIKTLVDQEGLYKMRAKSMNPEHPNARGCILGAEYHWLAAEKSNDVYDRIPDRVADMMNQYGKLTGRYYKPVEYFGPPDAKYVAVIMASGSGTLEEYVDTHPELKVGLLKVNLFRPFSEKYLLSVLPTTVEKICVLDKVRDVSANREPLYSDVCTALYGRFKGELLGGRYGIGSKDFAPNHAEAIYGNMMKDSSQDRFTVGLPGSPVGLPVNKPFDHLPDGTTQCMFWGLGSDGTVGSNKDAIKIIVENTDLYGQAYFSYSAHKSGGLTMSHVRFGKKPIKASYLVQNCDFVACHAPAYIYKFDMLTPLKDGGVFVLNCPDGVNYDEYLPAKLRKQIAEKNAKFYVVDASKIADKLGMTGRINMIMQTVFFSLAGVLPHDKAIALQKQSIEHTYIRKGREVVEKNWKMVDESISGFHQVQYDAAKWAQLEPEKQEEWTGFKRIVQMSMQNEGDNITVDQFTDIAAMPPGTSKIEKRGIAISVPKWEKGKCIQCNLCAFNCPHAVIRPFLFDKGEGGKMGAIPAKGKEFKGMRFRIQISPWDCTGCAVCVHTCPADALSMTEATKQRQLETANWEECIKVPSKQHLVQPNNVRNSQFYTPLLEFHGACAGCAEPAMIKLLTQLYGDQLYLANAAGCTVVWSSSYPMNPYTTNEHGHGPTWEFSLFEDNAEFGFGIHQTVKTRRNMVKAQLNRIIKEEELPAALKDAFEKLLAVWDTDDSQKMSIIAQKEITKVEKPSPLLRDIMSQADMFAKKTIFIMGGDGWAYDIGFGGLDHILASGEDVNVIVLDTEVYSNTGGQCSKSTQRGAVVNFAAAGYAKAKKDLGAICMTYGNIYVANICHLADPSQALKAIREARDYNGPSLIINYTPCIAHGIKKGLTSTPEHAKELLKAGYLYLYRYDPRLALKGKNPFQLDSKKPDFNLVEPLFKGESRFASLNEIYPEEAQVKHPQLVQDLQRRYAQYSVLASRK